MKNCVISNGLEAVVTIGLNCVDQGIDTRENVKASILGHVARHYVSLEGVKSAEDLPVAVLDRLHEALGLAFEAHGGKLIGVRMERGPSARLA